MFLQRSAWCLFLLLTVLAAADTHAHEPTVLFDGKNLDHWEFTPGGWEIEDGAMVCRLETVTDKKGNKRQKGKGYIWTKKSYGDFELTLKYKLSETANSGVFFRTDKDNPVQGGFEVQLPDNQGFQKIKGKNQHFEPSPLEI